MAPNPSVAPRALMAPNPSVVPGSLPVSVPKVPTNHVPRRSTGDTRLPPYDTRFSHFTQVAERKTRNEMALPSQNRQFRQCQPKFRISPSNWQSVPVTLGIPPLKGAAKTPHPSNFTMRVRRIENRVLRVVPLVRFMRIIPSRTGFSTPILSKASREFTEAICFF